ncbi:MAG: rod shape-determining protein MreD [Bacterioplanes sp.]|nr:rod shape-determining protein MreD [Bacterioplanes sp.]
MNIAGVLLVATATFIAFTLEHLPLPEMLFWFQPNWVLLLATLLVVQAPKSFGLWIALPLGLMLDVERATLLGLHVALLVIHVALLQALYRRLLRYHTIQQAGIVFLLVVLHQMLSYWLTWLVQGYAVPVVIWTPAFVSALLWLWLSGLAYAVRRGLHVS